MNMVNTENLEYMRHREIEYRSIGKKGKKKIQKKIDIMQRKGKR